MPSSSPIPTADQQRKRLLRILHGEGAKRGLDHDALSDGARMGYQVGSLAQLSLPQLRDYIQRLGTRPDSRGSGIGNRGSAEPRTPNTEPRRHARGSANAAMKVISPAQRHLIADLRDEIGWTDEQLDGFIAKQFANECSGMKDVRTSAEAARLITVMIGINRQRTRALRVPRNQNQCQEHEAETLNREGQSREVAMH
jgi:hypothetical protein